MKSISYLLLLTWVFALSSSGCSRDESSAEPQPINLKPSITFTANGTNYVWPAEYAGILKLNDSTYVLSATPPMSIVDSAFLIMIRSDSLTKGTYKLINTSPVAPGYGPAVCLLENSWYESTDGGDFATVSVSKIHDDLFDGTFVTLVTKADSSMVKLNITNGEFKNLKLHY